MQTSTKILNIALGFFGWFILGSLVSILFGVVFLTPEIVDIISLIIWLLTISVSFLLRSKKRIWILSGVLAAFATNGIIWLMISFSNGTMFPFLGETIFRMGFPLPGIFFSVSLTDLAE